jgi:4-hydroxy-4-methyl-2-oxoglutarate aldolase
MNDKQATLCARFSKLQPAVVHDVIDVMGLPAGVLSSRIRLLDPKSVICGPAFCARGTSVVGSRPAPASGSRPVFEIDRKLYQGCIFVGETGGSPGAVMGGNMGLAFKMRGARGIVIDGALRDANEFLEMGLPAAITHTTPMPFKGLFEWAELQVPVRLPGQFAHTVPIRPGDIVLGDVDGVVIIPAERAEEVAANAEKTSEMEQRIKADLAKGEDREAVYARHDRFGHISKV